MCVIFIVQEKRPPADMVEGAFHANGDGAGCAWREGGKVRFKKGLQLDEIQDLCATVPMPYVAHFRIRSVGDASEELTHPFMINNSSPLILEGSTSSHMLFHNGHWGKWKEMLVNIAATTGSKLPTGKWSDSRAMAWIASVLGLGYLELIDEKVVALGPLKNDLEIFGTGWIWREKEQMWVSNTSFEGGRRQWSATRNPHQGQGSYHTTAPASLPGNTQTGTTTDSSKKEQATGGLARPDTFHQSDRRVEGEGSSVSVGEPVKVSVEEGEEALRKGHRPGVPGSNEIRGAAEGNSAADGNKDDHSLVNQLRWATGLNPKRYRTASSITAEYERKGCTKCGRFEALQPANMPWYCQECRMKKDNETPINKILGCDVCGRSPGLRPADIAVWHCAECKARIVNEAQMGRSHLQSLNNKGITKMIC